MDAYRLTTLIETAQVIGNGIVDLCHTVTDIIGSFSDSDGEQEETKPKEERQFD